MKYTPLIGPDDQPAIEFNKKMMEIYYDPSKYKTYLEQLGIQYPTVKK